MSLATGNKKANPDFVAFVERFPPLAMPVILGEESHHVFSTENKPISDGMIAQFIAPSDPGSLDEFTEYVPCFAIDCEEKFIALVWWKAGLLNYEYYLSTYSEKGEKIDQKIIAYTRVKDNAITLAVATIDADLGIQILEGTSVDNIYDATSTVTRIFEIMANGMIVIGQSLIGN